MWIVVDADHQKFIPKTLPLIYRVYIVFLLLNVYAFKKLDELQTYLQKK